MTLWYVVDGEVERITAGDGRKAVIHGAGRNCSGGALEVGAVLAGMLRKEVIGMGGRMIVVLL